MADEQPNPADVKEETKEETKPEAAAASDAKSAAATPESPKEEPAKAEAPKAEAPAEAPKAEAASAAAPEEPAKAAEVKPEVLPDGPMKEEVVTADPVKTVPVSEDTTSNEPLFDTNKLDILSDLFISLTIEVGRAQIKIKDLLSLTKGSIIELNKLAGDPVDVYANGKLISTGSIITANGKYCVRLTSINEKNKKGLNPHGK